MNWTTTKVPMWQTDCENFWRVGKQFELRDVTTREHWEFVEEFTARCNLRHDISYSTVRFAESS